MMNHRIWYFKNIQRKKQLRVGRSLVARQPVGFLCDKNIQTKQNNSIHLSKYKQGECSFSSPNLTENIQNEMIEKLETHIYFIFQKNAFLFLFQKIVYKM